MFRKGRFKATALVVAAVIAAVWVFTQGVGSGREDAAAAAAPPKPGYGQADLQRDLNAIHAAGATGAIAEVTGARRLRGGSGVSDQTSKAPINVNDYFRMGSNTKTFVAVVVLQLVRERKLRLTDTVDRWLPGVVTGNGNDGALITVQELLQHTSGLHDYAADLIASVDSPESYQQLLHTTFTPQQLVTLALKSAPYFAPGQGWHYSNTNYTLLGMIIQKVTGHTWDAEVAQRVLTRLGLTHTANPGTATVLPNPHATGYETIDGTTVVHADENMTWTGSAGALYTTLDDLTRFWTAVVGRGQLLTPALTKQMRQTVPAPDADLPAGYRYGLGLGWRSLSCGGGAWTHDGDVPGYHTVSAVTANGSRSAVVSLNDNGNEAVFAAAWNLVDHALCKGA